METKENEKKIIFSKKVKIKDKFNFYEYLSVMLDWWISISESLESASDKVDSLYFKEKIKELIIYISSWDSFSKWMKKIPQIFDNWEISVIEAWETSWNLVDSLSKLSESLKKTYELRNKIKSALTYPLIILIFLFIALIVVLTFVIPAIKPLFENSDIELPWATKALIYTSDLISNNLWVLFLILATLYVLFIWYKNTKSWQRQIESFILWFPLIWKVYKNYILSNAALTLWNLTWAWINVVKTLTLVWKVTNNSIYEDLFDKISSKVSLWNKLIDSMKEVDPEKEYFPSDFTQMLSVWERTASIDDISKKISIQYDKEVSYSLSNLTKWIEPIAILVSWIFVLWFAFAIFWAILKITEVVS